VPAGTLAPGFAVAYHGERAAPALSGLGAAPRTPRHQEAGALGGAFWGFLFGLIFLVPFLGAGAGALLGSLRDVGISDAFIKDVREKITPGTSALFVLTSNAVLDRVAAEFRGSTGEIIHTNLSQEEEAKLHAAFDED